MSAKTGAGESSIGGDVDVEVVDMGDVEVEGVTPTDDDVVGLESGVVVSSDPPHAASTRAVEVANARTANSRRRIFMSEG